MIKDLENYQDILDRVSYRHFNSGKFQNKIRQRLDIRNQVAIKERVVLTRVLPGGKRTLYLDFHRGNGKDGFCVHASVVNEDQFELWFSFLEATGLSEKTIGTELDIARLFQKAINRPVVATMSYTPWEVEFISFEKPKNSLTNKLLEPIKQLSHSLRG